MATAVAQPSQHAELISVLDRVLDASARRGGLRFPRQAAEAVRLAVFIRRHHPLVIQAAHLVRIADACRPGQGLELLLGVIDKADADGFRRALRVDGRLRTVRIVDIGVEISAPARLALRLVGDGRPDSPSPPATFTLAFSQMPRALGMLEVLIDALDFPTVDGLIAPAIGERPATTAHAAARALSDRFKAWLDPRLASEHHLRKARRIRSYLDQAKRATLGAPDDALILAFWRAVSGEEADLGFKLYRSAVQGLLRYAWAEALCRMDVEVDDRSLAPAAERDGEGWVSPLAVLLRPPADRAKWLTKAEQARLRNFLGPSPDQADDGEPAEAPSASGPLAPGRPFPPALYRTLLRADRFGPIQDQLTRSGIDPQRRREALAVLAPGALAYHDIKLGYAEVKEQAKCEARAALHRLIRAEAPEAVRLIRLFLPRQALSTFLPEGTDLSGAPRDAARSIVQEISRRWEMAQALDPPLAALLESARTAARQVRREGFRPDDDTSGQIEAFAAAIEGLDPLIGSLTSLGEALGRAPLETWEREDQAAFNEQFRRLYPPTDGE
jgi:hypothetical protein